MSSIAVDIDSTLYDFETVAREGFLVLADKYDDKDLFRGAYDPWIEWRSPADSCGLDIWLEVIALCHAPEVILSRVPFEGAVDTCRALEAAGHELMFISARDGTAEEATEQWLRQQGFLGSNAQVVCAHDKTEHMAECQYLVDDRPKTVVEFVNDPDWNRRLVNEIDRRWTDVYRKYWVADRERTGQSEQDAYAAHVEWYRKQDARRAFVLEYPYNQNLSDVPGLSLAPTWAGINFYLVKYGLLEKPAYRPLGH